MKLKKVLLALTLLAFLATLAEGYLSYSLTGSRLGLCVSFLIVVLVIIFYREGIKTLIGEISERKKAEEEIKRLNQKLEEGCIERSADLFESEQHHRSLSEASSDPIVVQLSAKPLAGPWMK
jgi:hypothetical protein